MGPECKACKELSARVKVSAKDLGTIAQVFRNPDSLQTVESFHELGTDRVLISQHLIPKRQIRFRIPTTLNPFIDRLTEFFAAADGVKLSLRIERRNSWNNQNLFLNFTSK